MMKHLKKLTTLLLALALVLSLSVTGFAATVTLADGASGSASITVALPSGVTASNTYKIYKVFDATTNGTSISYTLVSGKSGAPEGFTVDTAGNVSFSGTSLSQENIAAIDAYVTDSDLMATVVTDGTESSFTVEGLPYGYYYITTTTGSVVTVDSTHPDATVQDKNTAPELDKSITGAGSIDEAGEKALAQVGKTVSYSVTITVGNGAENYVFHDQMSAGLQYNGDVSVTAAGSAVAESNYDTATAEGDTITVTFHNDFLSQLSAGTKLVISYTATVTSDALTMDPANNTAWLDYGHEPSSNSTPKDETEVYNARFTVTKEDGEGDPLAGAGFVIQNAAGKYYQLKDGKVSWVDSIDDATEYTSDETGAVTPFTGLENGTYTLVEKTVPDGYNKADDTSFTINAADFTSGNLDQSATVVNNAGSELPSTGGRGTAALYNVGIFLMLSALVLLVTKKRMGTEN